MLTSTVMRELLIADNKSPMVFNGETNKQTKNQSIGKLLETSEQRFSIELCPNRYLDTEALSKIGHRFCSVTWHVAPQSDLSDVERIPALSLAKNLRQQGYDVLLHLAGRNLSRCQMKKILDAVKSVGVRNILALRGDPPRDPEENSKNSDFPHADDLVKFIKTHYGNFFSIGVAGYPEKHPESDNLNKDIEYLKQKVSHGAEFIITQASHSYEAFAEFAKLCRTIGIDVPIVPGIFVISSLGVLTVMRDFCGISIPPHILDIVKGHERNRITIRNFGVYHATELIKKILKNGDLCGFHMFSLNDLELVKEVLKNVGFCGVEIERPLALRKSKTTEGHC